MNWNPEGYKVLCDTCGQRYYADQVRKQWDGIRACRNCFDVRHPVTQPLPAVVDDLSARNARPRHINYLDNPGGLSRWGVSYKGTQGLDANLTWGAWTEAWGGNPTSDDNIISR